MPAKLAVLYCALAAAWLPSAAAQQPARNHPADPDVRVPATQYHSAFSGYRPLRDEAVAPWRELNDEVARVGGHLGIVRSQAPAKNPSGHVHGAPK